MDGCGCHEYWFGAVPEDACGCGCHKEGPLIDCPLCGGSGFLDAENEGDRPLVKCDMCGGDGFGRAPIAGYLVDGKVWHPSDVTIIRPESTATPDNRQRGGTDDGG